MVALITSAHLQVSPTSSGEPHRQVSSPPCLLLQLPDAEDQLVEVTEFNKVRLRQTSEGGTPGGGHLSLTGSREGG
jgi:hypothetical protein